MLIDLPLRHDARKWALQWLAAQGIANLVLFQQVRIAEEADGRRFKAWLAEHG